MEEIAPPRPPGTAGRSWRARLDDAPLRSRLTGSFVIVTVLLVIVIGVSISSFVGLIEARHTLVSEVDPANLQADQLFVAYLNQETGVRGYGLSGNPIFLQPYTLGLSEESASRNRLTDLLAGQPHLLTLAHRAEAQAATWQRQFARPAVAATRRRETTFTSQAALLRGKDLFDTIRTRFDTLDAALAASRSSAEANLASSTAFLIGALIAALVLIVVTGILASRWLRLWVTDPLASVGSDSRAVAAGDTGHRIAPTGPPDFRVLADDVETMRKRIVEQLREAEEARSQLAALNIDLGRSNVELEQFAYVASHDLQEPLRKVTSFVQLLGQRYEGQLDERADQYIEFAVDGARRMQGLINDLLAFSRVGRGSEELEDVDLGSSLSGALANLKTVTDESDAEIGVGPLPVVKGNPSLLGSLWQNLVGNALKFRSEERPQVTIDAVRSDREWVVSVTDNGIGVEPRFADKIFVIFQRLHSRDAYDGSGIGLALCKKIVEFHGGRIWLDQSHQGGTRICFTLPVLESEVARDHSR
jgi:signal transduction histidine kinase